MPLKKRATIRKEPAQARSRERVQHIVTAARELLADLGFTELTVTGIAARAGIPTSSIYQYFSDKEAILKVILVEEVLSVRSTFDQVEQAYFLKVDWRTFFDRLWNSIYSLPIPESESTELMRAMYSSPDLLKVHEEHRADFAERLTRFLQGYGSKWPRQRLLSLSLLVFDVYLAIDANAATQTPYRGKELDTWRNKMIDVLLEDALAEA
jgi:AcrR family transcriptional regulator